MVPVSYTHLAEWLGLENEELEQVTGLQSAGFCHKGGFLMTVGMLEDAVKALSLIHIYKTGIQHLDLYEYGL